MQKLTRRGLIKRVSISAGAVGMLVTAIPVQAQAHSGTSFSTSTQAAEQSTSASGEALVVYVTPATGSLTVLRSERETTIKDSALVQRLLAL